jgi:threonine dehydratase
LSVPDMLTFEDVRQARERQAGYVRRTPSEVSADLSAIAGREVVLKLENQQYTGAFKLRGAISKNPAERARGVITASAGNHGQGVAMAARTLGLRSTVVLPVAAPLAKVSAIQRLGAEVVLEGSSYDEAHARTNVRLRACLRRPGGHGRPGRGGDGVSGDAPDLDALVVPVGGGGLIAGVATAARHLRPGLLVYGVQAAGSPALADSFHAGTLRPGPSSTIADGIAVKQPGEATFAVVCKLVEDIVTVSDEAIARSILLLLERHKQLAEAAGAAGLAAVLEGLIPPAARRIGVIVSGGNIDPILLGKVLQHGLASAGRYLALRTWLDDQPGQLHALTGLLGAERINILHVGIHRLGPYTALGRVGLDLIVETRDRPHAEEVLARIRAAGYPAEEALGLEPPSSLAGGFN